MQGKRQSFVLEKQLGMCGNGLRDARAGEVQLFRREMVSGNLSSPAAPLKAVLTGDRKIDVPEDGVAVGNRSPADERQRSARRIVQLSNEGLELALENYLSR
jgi:hypothetical protein